MIQAVQSQSVVQLNRTQTAVLQRTQATRPLQTQKLNPKDSLKIQGVKISDQEAINILKYISTHLGSLRRPRFFDSKKISVQDALKRLKEGDKVFVKNGKVKNIRDYFRNLNDLVLLDDLQGRKQDHGIAKPELRLPLLFLEGQKLESYSGGHFDDEPDAERLDSYNAYRELDKKYGRVTINGKDDLKAKDLASYVVKKGLSVSQDPGLQRLKQFNALPTEGWKINGRSVNRDTAYLAMITGSTQIQFEGMAIQNTKDFALLMSLVGNEDNGALDPTLKARILNFKLNGFSTPGIQNHYTVYKHLLNGQALSYQSNLIHSVQDLEVYDALEGTRAPSSHLPPQLSEALNYLKGGLSEPNLYQVWQKLGKNQEVSFHFKGGPTGENITLKALSHSELIVLKTQVAAQRKKDTLRPDLGHAKQIFNDRLPRLSQPIDRNLERTLNAADKARQDLPVQENRKSAAQADHKAIKPVHDRAHSAFKDAETVTKRAERDYHSDRNDYEWVKRDYDRIERNYDRAQRDYQSSISAARNYERQAQREEGLVSSDPKNADAHRRKAASLRGKSQSARSTADRRYNDMQGYRRDMDRKRWDLDRSRRDMEYSQEKFWNARSQMNSAKSEWQHQVSKLNDANGRIHQAERQINLAKRTIADAQVIETLSSKAKESLSQLATQLGNIDSYADYTQARDGLHQLMSQLKGALSNPTYTQVHGKALLNQLMPLVSLLNNMDKPAT